MPSSQSESHALRLLVERRDHPLAEVGALCDLVEDLPVEDVELQLLGEHPHHVAAAATVLAGNRQHGPVLLRLPLLAPELPAAGLLLDQNLQGARHGPSFYH